MSDFVRINDTILSESSCTFKFDGIPFVDVTALDYDQKRERKLVHTSLKSGKPRGKTSGKYSVGNFSFTMLRDSYDKLTDQLTIKGLGSYGDADFVFFAQYGEPGIKPITVIIDGCNIVADKEGMADGEAVTEVTCMGMTLTRNGKRLWSVQKGIM